MKYKKITAVLTCLCVMGASGFLGYQLADSKAQGAAVKMKDKPRNDVEESTRIAVVNLDKGVADQGETTHHADAVIQFPGSSFEYASLDEARTGLEDGEYGAYVIIPATFSESVASINATPRSARLEYNLNRKLSGKSQYTLLYDVLHFGDSINNRLSYMYLSNILEEFHQAQDGAETVLANDLKDKEAMDRIQPRDLVEMVPVPEIRREENRVESLIVDGYTARNTNLTDRTEEEYLSSVRDTQKQLDELKGKGGALSLALRSLSSKVQEIDVSKNAEGESIADLAGSQLDEVLNRQLEGRDRDDRNISGQVDRLTSDTDRILVDLERSLKNGNQSIARELGDILNRYKTDIGSDLPELLAEQDDAGNVVLRFEDGGSGKSPVLRLTLAEDSSSIVPALNNRRLLEKILQKFLAAKEETEQTEVDAAGAEEGNGTAETMAEIGKTVAAVFKECNADPRIKGLLNNTAYSDVEGFLQAVVHKKESLEPEKKIKVQGDAARFRSYLNQKIQQHTGEYKIHELEDVIYDADGNIQRDQDGEVLHISDQLEQSRQALDEINDSVRSSAKLDTGAIRDVFDKGYVSPIQMNAENAKNVFQERYESEVHAIGEHSKVLESYHPLLATEFVRRNMADMRENNGRLQGDVLENNRAYADYANRVYTTTTENVSLLEKNLQEAKQASAKAVEDGLSQAKGIKNGTSLENQNILAAFREKLPYTRMGSMEYTQAYEFIANPVIVEDKSDDAEDRARPVVQQTQASAIQDTKAAKPVMEYVLYGILGLLVVCVILYVVAHTGKRQQEKKQ